MVPLISYNGGREGARRLLVAAALTLSALHTGADLAAVTDPEPSPQVTVREERGVYSVTARFEVPQAPGIALAVLSDYEEIPRFMPDVRTSTVVERSAGRLMVEQLAVSRLMMFSKTIHLLLEVIEDGDTIRFSDRSGRSFTSYQGAWRAVRTASGTTITYQLTARPAFDVPEFILKRLLKRDSGQMISRLRIEIAARSLR